MNETKIKAKNIENWGKCSELVEKYMSFTKSCSKIILDGLFHQIIDTAPTRCELWLQNIVAKKNIFWLLFNFYTR